MDNLHLYDDEDGMIVCPRCGGDEYLDDINLDAFASHVPIHTYTCVKCFRKEEIGVKRIVRIPRRRATLQPLCTICQKVIVESVGDTCPGCTDRARIEGRDLSRDQAGLGRFC